MSSIANITTSRLTPLLSSTSYNLAYALPLLLFSLVITFAGTFLTLDRTRSFPSRASVVTASSNSKYNALPIPGSLDLMTKKHRFKWYLEGGIGGLLGGYIFGLHLATAMSILIPGTMNISMLSPRSFLAVWIVSVIVMTPLSARYRIAAVLFYGILGGTSISLSVGVITHPSLSARKILVLVFTILTPLLTMLTLIIPRLRYRFLHPLMRVCSASAGSFGLVIAIALLLNPKEESWANVWERLFLREGHITGPGWGNGREKGLTAAWAVFWAVGGGTDWALTWWIGECPDEKWDSYLTHYATNLPNHADRAGTYYPPTTIWDRWFPSSKNPFIPGKEQDILFPDDIKAKGSPTNLLSSLPYLSRENLPDYPAAPAVAMQNMGLSKPSSHGFDESLRPLTRVSTSRDVLKKPRKRRFMGWIAGCASDSEAQMGARPGVTRVPTRTKRKPVIFGDVSSSDDDTATHVEVRSTDPKRPTASRSDSSNAPTLVNGRISRASASKSGPSKTSSKVSSGTHYQDTPDLDYEKEVGRVRMEYKRRAADGIGGEYSDAEVEVETLQKKIPKRRATADGVNLNDKKDAVWAPAFLGRSPSVKTPSQTQWDELGYNNFPVAVPATPSLIRAIDRITVAQREAYGGGGAPTGEYLADRGRTYRPAQPRSQTHPVPRSPSQGKQPKFPLSPLNHSGTEDVWGKEQKRRERAKRMEEAEKVMEGKIEPRGETDRLPRGAGIASDEEDSGDDLEGGNRGRGKKAPKWDEFWREVKTKAKS